MSLFHLDSPLYMFSHLITLVIHSISSFLRLKSYSYSCRAHINYHKILSTNCTMSITTKFYHHLYMPHVYHQEAHYHSFRAHIHSLKLYCHPRTTDVYYNKSFCHLGTGSLNYRKSYCYPHTAHVYYQKRYRHPGTALICYHESYCYPCRANVNYYESCCHSCTACVHYHRPYCHPGTAYIHYYESHNYSCTAHIHYHRFYCHLCTAHVDDFCLPQPLKGFLSAFAATFKLQNSCTKYNNLDLWYIPINKEHFIVKERTQKCTNLLYVHDKNIYINKI